MTLKNKIVFGSLCLLFTIFTCISFKERSFPRMNVLARGEFLSYVYEYNVDTAGFLGPALELMPNDILLYTWKKNENDSTAAMLKVFVRHERLSETSVHTSGSEEYWKKLRGTIPRPEYKR